MPLHDCLLTEQLASPKVSDPREDPHRNPCQQWHASLLQYSLELVHDSNQYFRRGDAGPKSQEVRTIKILFRVPAPGRRGYKTPMSFPTKHLILKHHSKHNPWSAYISKILWELWDCDKNWDPVKTCHKRTTSLIIKIICFYLHILGTPGYSSFRSS